MENCSITRGDIVILDFGKPAGSDDHTASKMRPALVIQNNVANRNSPVTIVAIITTYFNKMITIYLFKKTIHVPISIKKFLKIRN